MQPWLIFVIILVLAALATVAWRQDQKRRRLLRAWARSQGLKLVAEKQRGWEREYAAFRILERGHSRHTPLHIEGEVDGHRVRCLDYRFTTGSGKNRQTHRRALVILDVGTPVIPLCIRPEHVFDRVGEFFGHDDLDFESVEFSRRFHVSAADRKWAYDVIHQRTMDYLLEAPPVTIEFGFAEIAVINNGSLTPDHCHQGLKVARRMLELVPQDVLAQLKGDHR
jgi:hypothetical protein